MRRLFAGWLAGLVLTAAALSAGCGSKTTTQTPKMVEPPKEGPQPVGGGGGPKGAGGGGGAGKSSTDT